jgi:hypothetical protein
LVWRLGFDALDLRRVRTVGIGFYGRDPRGTFVRSDLLAARPCGHADRFLRDANFCSRGGMNMHQRQVRDKISWMNMHLRQVADKIRTELYIRDHIYMHVRRPGCSLVHAHKGAGQVHACHRRRIR